MTGLVLRVIEPDRHCVQRSEGGVLGLECQKIHGATTPSQPKSPKLPRHDSFEIKQHTTRRQ